MIDAKELRIGNWVRTVYPINKEPFQVYPMWFKQLPTDKDNNLIVHNWEPIPLTEQWLIDLGLSGRLGEVSDTYHIGINPVTHDWLFDIVWIHGTDYPFYRNGQFMIKHVHQLQNLYFALTGEDLHL